ncbi:M48 family metallopeptidase [Sporobolomyces koalae]|uniref:M48 family metallopeptidase n=1 Tax=Sporobolomyces koalae TaxID=500713 RepID=UPI00316DD526
MVAMTSRRSLSSTATRSAYRRFGQSQRPTNNPWQIIEKLPTPNNRSGSQGSRFSEVRYRATTLLKQPLVLVLIGGGGAYYVTHLEQVPESGRWRFMDTSEETEREMAVQSFNEVMQQYQRQILPESHPQSKYVTEIVRRIVESNDLQVDAKHSRSNAMNGWQVFVVQDDSTQNAFVIPGGKIFVFSGILPIAKDQDGLAVILGHEIAHQVARHSAERLSSMKVLVALSYLLTSLGLDLGLSRVLLNVGMTLPNSRKNESEADLIGLRLANNACYNPLAAEQLWKRMDAASGGAGGSLDFLSTHPSSSNRSVKVREWAQDVLKERPEHCSTVREHLAGFQQSVGWR